jgi:hypothetical protein
VEEESNAGLGEQGQTRCEYVVQPGQKGGTAHFYDDGLRGLQGIARKAIACPRFIAVGQAGISAKSLTATG